jgi:ubiquinone biosynthesis protein
MPVRPVRHLRRYRQISDVLFRHGFAFALEQLGLGRRAFGRILHRAGASPAPAWPEDMALHLRQAVEELGPTFIKLGQILSTRPDLLPPAYIAELSKLQDTVPPAPWDEIRQVLIAELGQPPEAVFAAIDPQPLACAAQ